MTSGNCLFRSIAIAALLVAACAPPARAQWLNYKTPGIPRTPDGQPNLNAPAPRTPDGKADITGLWQPAGIYVADIAKDLKPDAVPYQPWAEALYKQRRANESKDDPTGYCIPGGVPRSDAVPYPFKILNLPGMMVILYEAVHSYRQIFTDGRELPRDPNPTWMGYSIGHWEGDSMVVETSGFNDHGWLDNNGRAPPPMRCMSPNVSGAKISATWKFRSRLTTRKPTLSPGPSPYPSFCFPTLSFWSTSAMRTTKTSSTWLASNRRSRAARQQRAPVKSRPES